MVHAQTIEKKKDTSVVHALARKKRVITRLEAVVHLNKEPGQDRYKGDTYKGAHKGTRLRV